MMNERYPCECPFFLDETPNGCSPTTDEYFGLEPDLRDTVGLCGLARYAETHEKLTAALEREKILTELVDAKTQALASATELAEKLALDPNARVLTYTAFNVLIDRLIDNGLLERMKQAGFRVIFFFGDVDKLKQHNTLGGHGGGDVAIKGTSRILTGCFRRKYDAVVGVLGNEREAEEAHSVNKEYATVSRYDQGDEAVAVSFIPPVENERRNPGHDAQMHHDRIKAAFDGATISYRLTADPKTCQEFQNDPAAFDFTVEDDMVRAPLSVTFAVVSAPIPTTKEQFEAIKEQADEKMMDLKKERQTVATAGLYLTLTEAELQPAP